MHSRRCLYIYHPSVAFTDAAIGRMQFISNCLPSAIKSLRNEAYFIIFTVA